MTPKPTQTKTFQFGSVLKTNAYAGCRRLLHPCPERLLIGPGRHRRTGLLHTADTHTKGFEVEGNGAIGWGFFLYGNATVGSAKYADTHLWVASSPHDTETAGLTYLHGNWDFGFFNKRIGRFYNDNGSTNQAVRIDPFNITNLFFNYTMKRSSYLRGTKFRLGFNNLFDQAQHCRGRPSFDDYLCSGSWRLSDAHGRTQRFDLHDLGLRATALVLQPLD